MPQVCKYEVPQKSTLFIYHSTVDYFSIKFLKGGMACVIYANVREIPNR